ncbi:MAG: HAMP domain-containing sensor histidine kinase [Pseudomonadota bacterium]
MQRRVTRKWRPRLAFVLFGALATMLALTGASYFALRLLVPQLGWIASVALIGAVLLGAASILAWLLSRLILRPVQALKAQAREGSDGALAPLEQYGTRELGEMGEAVLAMAVRLHGRVEDISTYADHITHELKTPLTTLAATAELLEEETLSARERADLHQKISQATARMQLLLSALQSYARATSAPSASEATPPQRTENASTLFQLSAQEYGLLAEAPAHIALPWSADVSAALFDQLASNAANHGASRIVLAPLTGAFTIADDGSGISEGNRHRVFDPFFTTRRARGGTGMGLAIVRRLLNVQGAEISLLPQKNGTKFRIDLPN